MKRIKKTLNIARQSGYSSKEVPAALASMNNEILEEKPYKTLDITNLTEEQKITLRAAGYLKI